MRFSPQAGDATFWKNCITIAGKHCLCSHSLMVICKIDWDVKIVVLYLNCVSSVVVFISDKNLNLTNHSLDSHIFLWLLVYL